MTEQLPRKLSRLFATAIASAGASVFALAFVLPPVGDGEWSTTIRTAAAFVGGALFVAGAAVAYLVSARPLLASERRDRSAADGSSWLAVPALILVAVTSWMFIRLTDSMSLWRDIMIGLDRLDIWRSAREAPQFSGWYLAPIGLVVAAPALHALAAAGFALGASVVLVMMLTRSSRLPRAFLMVVLLLGVLVFSSGVATMVAARAIPVVEQAIREIPDPDGEGARWLREISRYTDATQSASWTLTWTWVAWALLLPVLVWSNRAASTFAPVREPSIDPIDHRIKTDAERERYFEDMARRLDSR